MSSLNAWDHSSRKKPGMHQGMHKGSVAEEIARGAPAARVVEAIPPTTDIPAAGSHWLPGQKVGTFYCGDDEAAKAAVAGLLRDLDLEPVDAGPLRSARYIEPAGMLVVQPAYNRGLGPHVGMKVLRGGAA